MAHEAKDFLKGPQFRPICRIRFVLMGIAARLIVCSALAHMSASASAQQPAIDATKFYSALSCRLSTISGGQLNRAAIFEDTPDPVNPLRLIRINTGTPGSELEVITPRKSLLIGHIGSLKDQLYWTPNDDLVIWTGTVFQHLLAKDIRPTPTPRFRITWASVAGLEFSPDEDVIPEHIRTTARIVGGPIDRQPLQFEVTTRDVSYLPVPVGSYSAAAWTEDDEFVRLRTDYSTWQKYLDVFEPATSEWVRFTPTAMPRDSALVLVRNSPADANLDVVIRWREQGGDRIGIVRRGAPRPQVIASDKFIGDVLVSPDRSRVYGFVDLLGRFHRIGTESQKPGIAFWLTQFETKEDVRQAYFLNDAKFALIRARGPVAGPQVQLLERRGNTVNVRHTFCTGGGDVGRVAEGQRSILFVPKESTGNKLIVYLHDGISARANKTGNWLIDLLIASGNPVLAVNYTGSIVHTPPGKNERSWGEVFGDEIASEIAFARGELGIGEQPVVFVGEGFGSLVGLAALRSQKVAPSGFLGVSGPVSPDQLLSQLQSSGSLAFGDYGRTAREVRAALDPSKIRANHPQLEFLFVHGDKDRRAPYADVVKFAQSLALPGRPATALIRDMDHEPYRRAHYDEIVKAVGDFLARH